jgi:transcriptional regulator of arginine metabolism
MPSSSTGREPAAKKTTKSITSKAGKTTRAKSAMRSPAASVPASQAAVASPEQRRASIAELLASGEVSSQGTLSAALVERGIEVNQATLSRDLKALGVVKGPAGYKLPGTIAATAPSGLAGAVRAWVASAVPSQNFVIVRTPPGGASPLAVAIDQAQFGEILGTIAGDDTVFIATPDVRSAKRLLGKLSNLGGGSDS